jgi:DNA-directed RNA polymerase specialized sigma24 family protein
VRRLVAALTKGSSRLLDEREDIVQRAMLTLWQLACRQGREAVTATAIANAASWSLLQHVRDPGGRLMRVPVAFYRAGERVAVELDGLAEDRAAVGDFAAQVDEQVAFEQLVAALPVGCSAKRRLLAGVRLTDLQRTRLRLWAIRRGLWKP